MMIVSACLLNLSENEKLRAIVPVAPSKMITFYFVFSSRAAIVPRQSRLVFLIFLFSLARDLTATAVKFRLHSTSRGRRAYLLVSERATSTIYNTPHILFRET